MKRQEGRVEDAVNHPSISSFFHRVPTQDNSYQMRLAFKELGSRIRRTQEDRSDWKHGTEDNKIQRDDSTIGVATYNVRGLVAHTNVIAQQLKGLKERQNNGARDFIFLQKTHLNSDGYDTVSRQNAAMWASNTRTKNPYLSGRQETEDEQELRFWFTGTDTFARFNRGKRTYGQSSW